MRFIIIAPTTEKLESGKELKASEHLPLGQSLQKLESGKELKEASHVC